MNSKLKGDLGQLIVAQDLVQKGWSIAFPYGENSKYDLIAEKDGVFRRIQVKSVHPRKGTLRVSCRSSNNWSVYHYSQKDFEYMAAVDLSSSKVYYIDSARIHKSLLNIRLVPTKNGQSKGINMADSYLEF